MKEVNDMKQKQDSFVIKTFGMERYIEIHPPCRPGPD
jgi:hypothetical protein